MKQISSAAKDAGRTNDTIRLIAVSKTVPGSVTGEAVSSGQVDFGENRIQEVVAKWPDRVTRRKAVTPNAILHLIGPLQSNKARRAIVWFDWIHSLDRPSLAETLARLLREQQEKQQENSPEFLPFPRLLIQINVGQEFNKSGVSPKNADDFITRCKEEWDLPVVGLMCIPPVEDPPAPHFALLKSIADRHGLPELSMGMSSDFSEAIRQGATCIRVGTALFGKRTPLVSPVLSLRTE